MKMHISIRLILSLLLSLSGTAFAQSNFLWVADVTGNAADEGLAVNIELVNEDSIAGFQFTLQYNEASISINTVVAGERLDGLDAQFSRPAPGQVMVMVFSLAGNAIPPGVGPALQLALSITPGAPDGVEALSMSDIVFSDPGGNTLPGAGLDGYVIVGDINVLRMRNGYLSNRLDLYNHLSIGGLQFTLGYDANIFDLDTVLATVRSGNMVLDYNEPQPGTVITLLYSDVGDSILTGSGNVLEFFFNNVQDSSSIVNQLHLSDVTLSGPGGEVVSIEAIDGNHLLITRLIQVQSLDIGGDENIQHLVNHTPAISFDYFDSMGQPQTHYQVQVSTEPEFTTIDMWDTDEVGGNTASTTYAGAPLLDGQTYYLRVKAGSEGFWSGWSVLPFRMNSLASEPEAISPVDNLVVIAPIDLRIRNSNDPEGDILVYFFDVYEDAARTIKLDSAQSIIEGLGETGWRITAILPDNGQYWWTAGAFDGYEFSPVTKAYSFLVNAVNNAPGAFTLIDPPENAEGLEPVVNFKWHRSIDPDPLDTIEYILYYAPDWSDTATYTAVEGLVDTTFTATLSNDTEYYWLVEALDQDNLKTASNGGTPQRFVVGTVGPLGVDELAAIPGEFALHQNYPNPFNPSTALRFDLPEATIVTIMVYDMLGQEVARLVNRQMGVGYHQAVWNGRTSDGREAPAGIYIARLHSRYAGQARLATPGYSKSIKMLLLK